MSTHTPGPWRIGANGSSVYGSNCDNAYIYLVAQRMSGANARLVAAAPDMLAVLQELEESAAYWSEYDVPLGIVDRLRAVIAKSTGGAK